MLNTTTKNIFIASGRKVSYNFRKQNGKRQKMITELKDFLRSRQKINLSFIAVNILIFVIMELTQQQDWFYVEGACYTPFVLNGQYYRLFTSMFLHFGIEHLGNNMICLLFLGDMLERLAGKWRYCVIYLGGGLLGNLLSMAVEMRTHDYALSAGASGAIFAVIGALLYIVLRNRERMGEAFGKRMLLIVFLMLFQGFTSSGVDNSAHIGGLIGGMILSCLLCRKIIIRRKKKDFGEYGQ